MGLILDSTVLIAAERRAQNVYATLSTLADRFPGEAAGISVVTLLELAHGVERADTEARRSKRAAYLADVELGLPVYPVTSSIALRAGHIAGASNARGIQIALADLLIGVTALDLGFRVVTANLRHFNLIPGVEAFSI